MKTKKLLLKFAVTTALISPLLTLVACSKPNNNAAETWTQTKVDIRSLNGLPLTREPLKVKIAQNELFMKFNDLENAIKIALLTEIRTFRLGEAINLDDLDLDIYFPEPNAIQWTKVTADSKHQFGVGIIDGLQVVLKVNDNNRDKFHEQSGLGFWISFYVNVLGETTLDNDERIDLESLNKKNVNWTTN